MGMKKFRALSVLTLLLMTAGSVFGQTKGEIISIPGIGDIGIQKNGSTYTVALKDWGTYDFTGKYKSSSDFDLATSLPAGDFTDYIPGAGQLLSILGLDTVELRLKPNGMGVGLSLADGGLGALRGTVTEALSQVKVLSMVIDSVISGLEIRSMVVNATIFGKTLKGTVEGEIAVIGKKIKFKEDGELNLKKLVGNIVDSIVPAVSDFATDAAKAAYKASRAAVLSVGKNGVKKVDQAWDEVSAYTKEAVKTIDYATNSYDENLKKDLPKFIKAKANPMLKEGNRVMDELYDELLPLVRNMDGQEKTDAINEAFLEVVPSLEKRWKGIYDDDSVKSWSTIDSREKELRKKYRAGIQAEWDDHKGYREKVIGKLIASKPLIRIARKPKEALDLLSGYAKARIPVIIETKIENLAWDVQGGVKEPAKNGTKVFFYPTHGEANEQWLLIPAGKPNAYHFQSIHSGRFLHISSAKDEQGSSFLVWDGANTTMPQTIFTASADAEGYIRFSSQKGFYLDLAGGKPVSRADIILGKKNSGDGQAFYIYPAPKPYEPVAVTK